MTFYKSVPVVVEALRFDGSGISAMTIMNWLIKHGHRMATFHEHQDPRVLPGNTYQSAGWQAQLDLGIPHVKIAEVSDYVVRLPEKTKSQFRVMTEEHFKATYVETPELDYLKGI